MVRNDEIRRRAGIGVAIIESIELKQFMWFGYQNRMPETRWHKKIWKWAPTVRRRLEKI